MAGSQVSRREKRTGRRLGRTALIVLIAVYIMGAALIWLDPESRQGGGSMTDIGTLLVLIDLVAILALDWRGFATLRGRIGLSEGLFSRITNLCLLLAFLIISPITIGIYLFLAVRDYRRGRKQLPITRQRHIAEMEAELGMLPGTQGTCRVCGKPLQVGAEYCAFCGATPVAKPRVCPACAAVALPGATYCPECPPGSIHGQRMTIAGRCSLNGDTSWLVRAASTRSSSGSRIARQRGDESGNAAVNRWRTYVAGNAWSVYRRDPGYAYTPMACRRALPASCTPPNLPPRVAGDRCMPMVYRRAFPAVKSWHAG